MLVKHLFAKPENGMSLLTKFGTLGLGITDALCYYKQINDLNQYLIIAESVRKYTIPSSGHSMNLINRDKVSLMLINRTEKEINGMLVSLKSEPVYKTNVRRQQPIPTVELAEKLLEVFSVAKVEIMRRELQQSTTRYHLFTIGTKKWLTQPVLRFSNWIKNPQYPGVTPFYPHNFTHIKIKPMLKPIKFPVVHIIPVCAKSLNLKPYQPNVSYEPKFVAIDDPTGENTPVLSAPAPLFPLELKTSPKNAPESQVDPKSTKSPAHLVNTQNLKDFPPQAEDLVSANNPPVTGLIQSPAPPVKKTMMEFLNFQVEQNVSDSLIEWIKCQKINSESEATTSQLPALQIEFKDSTKDLILTPGFIEMTKEIFDVLKKTEPTAAIMEFPETLKDRYNKVELKAIVYGSPKELFDGGPEGSIWTQIIKDKEAEDKDLDELERDPKYQKLIFRIAIVTWIEKNKRNEELKQTQEITDTNQEDSSSSNEPRTQESPSSDTTLVPANIIGTCPQKDDALHLKAKIGVDEIATTPRTDLEQHASNDNTKLVSVEALINSDKENMMPSQPPGSDDSGDKKVNEIIPGVISPMKDPEDKETESHDEIVTPDIKSSDDSKKTPVPDDAKSPDDKEVESDDENMPMAIDVPSQGSGATFPIPEKKAEEMNENDHSQTME